MRRYFSSRPNTGTSIERGITLIELLIVLVATVLIIGSSARAVISSVSIASKATASRKEFLRDAAFEDRLRKLISSAYLSSNDADPNSYFVGGDGSQNQDASLATSGNSLTFTSLGSVVPQSYLQQRDRTFEELNLEFGPMSGITEVALSLSPVGDAPVQQGLFIRTQIPADGDLTQGGFEYLLDADIEEITFEFWDGLQWVTVWDTQADSAPRLPASVRCTYRRQNSDLQRVVVVRIPLSDVTPLDPYTQGGGA